jgi:hypothetical protein
MIWLAWQAAAPWYSFPPLLFAFLAGLWMLAVNRRSGLLVSCNGIAVRDGPRSRFFARDRLQAFKVNQWSEGPDEIILVLVEETHYHIPSHCLGDSRRVRAALGVLGIHEAA